MQPDPQLERAVSAALIRLRVRSPYLATLALFAAIAPSDEQPTGATDGRTIYLNPEYFGRLPPAGQDVALLHLVLHAALCHVARRAEREPWLWNTACDLAVNGILAQQQGLKLPDTLLRDPELERWSVEEIYEFLLVHPSRAPLLEEPDLLDAAPDDSWKAGYGLDDPTQPPAAAQQTYWRKARDQAEVIAIAAGSELSPGLRRELGTLEPGKLDWRAHLWRFLVRTPTDFQGYDRRFIHSGLYLDALEGESARVHIAIDTSGSMSTPLVSMVMSEAQGIVSAYPYLVCELYFADTALHGPHLLRADSAPPIPEGGGGTDFRPFFAEVERPERRDWNAVCVYLTDGHGQFPDEAPALPTLWIVTPGGRDLEDFPFGETVRIMPD
ncbi:MAG TPA: VWA-like domain-containing protein [Herpetosiphonaceae bacterium]